MGQSDKKYFGESLLMTLGCLHIKTVKQFSRKKKLTFEVENNNILLFSNILHIKKLNTIFNKAFQKSSNFEVYLD